MHADIPIPRAHDLTGSVLGGRYEVLGKLGIGGMAAVYEGRRLGLHNRVAIKVLKDELCEDPGNVKRFLREARAASVIEHENIVQIIDFGPVDGTPVYFVMEFLEGSDLRRVIKQVGPLPWSQAQPILLQVVSALGAAHDKGIVHRDVKPANIYLVPRPSSQPMIKVLDFGIAKVVEEGRGGITRGLTMTNGLLGTVAYMAPEQARGGKIDARTDIYALGVVAYQVMTGSVPFTGNNPFSVLERHVNEIPRPPSELVASIPPGVDAIVLRCMAKRPEERYQSMPEVAEAIRRVAAFAMPTMGEPAPVVGVTAGPDAWARPPELEIPLVDATPRVVATSRLGSGSNQVVPVGSETARSPSTWAAPPVAVTSRTPPTTETLEQSRTTNTLPRAFPYRAFFALGFGLGIVAACAIAFLAVTHYDREPDVATDRVVDEVEPAPLVAPAKVVDEPQREPDEPQREPDEPDDPEPHEAEPELEDTAAADTVSAEPVATHTGHRKKKKREVTPTKADERNTSSTKETKRDTGQRDPDTDVHPDLREPYK